MNRDTYWDNIVDIYQKQTDKGINKYGQILEQNIQMTLEERLTYLEEELVDALMYCEHIKKLYRDYPFPVDEEVELEDKKIIFKEGQLVVYKGSYGYEIGKIKKIKDETSAWIWYHGGDTAALTDFSLISPLRNAYYLEEILNKEKNND